MVGIGIILLFAIIGVVSAGIFVGGRVNGKSASKPPTPRASTGNPIAAQDLARARAQATQIVQAAQQSSKSLIAKQTSSARKQAAAIVAAARRQAASIAASASSASAATGPSASTGSTGAYSAAGSTSSGAYSGAAGSTTPAYGSTGPTTAAGTPPSATVNLSNLPASWLVVAYNARFGAGPGSAGSITVTNRSSRTFSGTAQVRYATGGAASAPFSGIAPGQTIVLPLNGPAYPGGGYNIQVINPH
jgi:hypothetical protein